MQAEKYTTRGNVHYLLKPAIDGERIRLSMDKNINH